ncbi:MAG: ATP-binding protein [Limisphaerales bacterium]
MVGLESIALFRNLDRGELQALRFITREKRFAANQEIFREGDPGDGVFFVKDGAVEISSIAAGSARHIFSRLGPGEIFGEMAVIEHRPRSATAAAVQDTEVYVIPRGEMLSLIERSPALAFNLLQEISRRLREFNQLHLREVIEAERLALVGNFARSIVHDLKNPLTIISLSAETFNLPNIPPELRAQAQARIRKQVERINDMVSDILIFTGGECVDAEIKAADYRAFVLELLADLRAEAELKVAQIEMENEPPAVRVPIEPRRLSRVFYNLVHNATDAMAGGGKIFLRFRRDENEIATEIEDTGPGIAPEIAGKLFQPFATFGKIHGTGLGLSICKKIVEDHGGRIWVRGEYNRGAIFCFTLPAAK